MTVQMPEPSLVVDLHREVTPDEVKALITIETIERLAAVAFRRLVADRDPSDESLKEVQDLLAAISTEAATRTCTAVKSMALSDQIADQARAEVRDILAGIEAR